MRTDTMIGYCHFKIAASIECCEKWMLAPRLGSLLGLERGIHYIRTTAMRERIVEQLA